MAKITPGYTGWTLNAPKILGGIAQKERNRLYAENAPENARARERAELEYYEENGCFPRPSGYFGTETDAHYFER